MSSFKSEGVTPSQFTTLLRMTSGQETEPEFVLVEHSYARPWNWHSKSSNSHPRKTLFLSKLPRTESEDIIDVVKDFPSNTAVPYDLVRGRHLMSECERHVIFAKLSRIGGKDEETEMEKEECDWELTVNKSGWTEMQHYIFNRIVKIVDADRLARLTLKDTVNEPIKRRAQIDKTAAKFRQTLGRMNWDLKLTQWLHNTLLQNMTTPYLAAYLDILQTLKSKIPNLVDKVISLSNTQKGPSIEALNLLLKRPWDPAIPVLSQQKLCKLEKLPIVIQVPSGATSPNVPQASRRIRFFNSQLQHLAKCIPVSVTSETSDPASILEQLMYEVQMRIMDCKTQYPSHPIVLLGWGVGAVLACHVSLTEKVCANVCLGFPMMDHEGKRGEADDPLLNMRTPTLFVMGERSTNATVDDVEDFRYHMQAESSLVVISGADLLLKMALEKRCWDGLTQSMVDRCIVDEIGDFLTRTFNEDNKPPPSSGVSLTSQMPSSGAQPPFSHSSTFTNPSLPLKMTKRDGSLQRKRKLSPMSLADSASLQVPSKIMRTGTAISHTLGLKIPVGVSSVASFMKQEGKIVASSVATVGGEVEDSLFTDSGNVDGSQKGKTLRKVSESAPLSYKSLFSSNRGGLADAAVSAKPSASNSPGPFDSNGGSTLSMPRASLASLSMSGGSPSFATIPLGSFASLTRQRHHQMMQISENSDQQASLWPSTNRFDWRAVNPKGQEDTDSDVDICGLSSVASTPARAIDSPSTRDFGKGGGLHAEGVPFLQEKQHSRGCVDASTPGHILVTSSLGSSVPTAPPKVPGTTKRGRPPGRPKGSTNANLHSKGRGKEPSTSMAVLTFTGAAGNGSGVESAGKGISSLGRGVLTLSKGGTSTVRVYSASGQKLSSSQSATTVTTGIPSNASQKSRGFLLTNISASSSVNPKTVAEKPPAERSVAMSGRVNSCKTLANNDAGVRVTTTSTAAAAIVTATTTSGQVSLNLQGISASRAVSFASARPAAVMLLPSPSAATSAANNITATNTTTTISSGGLKTTKSVIGVRQSVEELKSSDDAEVVPFQEEKTPSSGVNPDDERAEPRPTSSIWSRRPDEEGHRDDDLLIGSSVVSSKIQPKDSDKSMHGNEEPDNSKSVLVTKTKKTLLLGTRVVPSPPRTPAMKSNITFISSKALNKAFPSSDKFPTPTSVHTKSLLKNNPTCAFLKMSPKTSSIRLVRSVGTPLSTSGPLKGALSNSSSVGNIVTKTFTISSNPTKEALMNKRRVSLDSATISVSKRSRGTSTDQMVEEPTLQDFRTLSFPSAGGLPDTASEIKLFNPELAVVIEQNFEKELEENNVLSDTSRETDSAIPSSTFGDSEPSTETSPALPNTNRTKIFRQLSTTKKISSAEVRSPVTKIVSPPKGQTLTIPNKETVTTNIKVTRELVTSSVTRKGSATSSVSFQDKEYFKTNALSDPSSSGTATSSDCKDSSTSIRESEKAFFEKDSSSFPVMCPDCDPETENIESLKVKDASTTIRPRKNNSCPTVSPFHHKIVPVESNEVKPTEMTSKSRSPSKTQVTSPSSKSKKDLITSQPDFETTEKNLPKSDVISLKLAQAKTGKEKTKASLIQDPEETNDGREVSRPRRASLTLVKTSNFPHLSSTPPRRNKSKDTDSSPRNRVTRSTAKTAATQTKRFLRSSL